MTRDRRRRLLNRVMEALATLAALAAVAVLAIVVISVARRAAGAVSWDFFTKPQALFGQPGGGIANASGRDRIARLARDRDGAARRCAHCDLPHRVRASAAGCAYSGGDRRACRAPDDRDRDLRLRVACNRTHAEWLRGRVRTRGDHASPDLPSDPGGAAPRPFDAEGSEPRTRCPALANRPRRDLAVERWRHRHRDGPGSRARGR